MRRILITGANRGIGLDLTRRYLEGGERVFATCRHPEEAEALQVLAQENEQLKIIRLEVTDQASIEEARRLVGTEVDGLEILINNAGIYPDGVFPQASHSSTFGYLDAGAMLEVFQVNTVSPVIVTQAFDDLLRKGKAARVINMSSDAGSITQQQGSGNYSYPGSKAALNMMTRCLAGDFRAHGVIVVSVHPGWIRTDMGGERAPLSLDEAMPSVMQVIDRLTMTESGEFFNWDGRHVPW